MAPPQKPPRALSRRDTELVSDVWSLSDDDDSSPLSKQFEILALADAEAAAHLGPLRPGGPPRLLTWAYGGVLVQYAAIGLVDGVLPATIYPFLQNYLNVPGRTSLTASILIRLPWSLKLFYGILSDCRPLYGYRRRPYLVLGWTIACAMLLLMGLLPVPRPYFTDARYRHTPPRAYTPEIEATLHRASAHAGGVYVVGMMLCATGYLMADVAADGLVVELAQREPVATRGRTQAAIYGVRTVFNLVALGLCTLGLNGAEYGGDFGFSLSFPMLMLVLAGLVAPVIPISWYGIPERPRPRVELRQYLDELWGLAQSRALYQVIAYTFLHGVLWNVSYTSINPIQAQWVRVTPLQETASSLGTTAAYAGAIYLTGRFGLHWGWRRVTLGATLVTVGADAVVSMLTIWDVYRGPWLWLGVPVLQQLPNGALFLVSMFVIVELATVGHEAALYGLLSSVGNLTKPLAVSLTNVLNAPFELTTERLQDDHWGVRRDVTWTIGIMYALNLASLAFLGLLPRQKAEAQFLRRYGGSSRIMGAVTVGYLTLAFAWSLGTNLLAVFPSTACLRIAGGGGCPSS